MQANLTVLNQDLILDPNIANAMTNLYGKSKEPLTPYPYPYRGEYCLTKPFNSKSANSSRLEYDEIGEQILKAENTGKKIYLQKHINDNSKNNADEGLYTLTIEAEAFTLCNSVKELKAFVGAYNLTLSAIRDSFWQMIPNVDISSWRHVKWK